MNKQTGFNTILAVLIFALVIGGLVVGLSSYFTERDTTDVLEYQRKYAEKIATWTLSTHELYGYSFKYPNDWPSGASDPSTFKVGSVNYEPSAPFLITVYEGKDLTFIQEFKKNYPGGCGEEQPMMYAGLNETRLVCIEPYTGRQEQNHFIEHKGNLFRMHYLKATDSLNATFLDILSTFKFTDPIAEWESYSNNVYSFRYPASQYFVQSNENGVGENAINISVLGKESPRSIFDIETSGLAINRGLNLYDYTKVVWQLNIDEGTETGQIDELVIDENKAYTFTVSGSYNSGTVSRILQEDKGVFFLENNDSKYTILITKGSPVSEGILSTFQFVD